MKLYHSPASPFARKVVIVARHHGIALDLVPTNPHVSPAGLLAANPLAKIPALVTDEGLTLPDSPLICEFLDHVGTAEKLFPAAGGARWKTLRLAALADGMMTAAVLWRGQSLSPVEAARTALMERQKAAIWRTLDLLEGEGVADALNIGTIGLVCALGYLDFRFAAEDWRAGHPRLAEFQESQMRAPLFAETAPQG